MCFRSPLAIGVANFYRRFIKDFSKAALPLDVLAGKRMAKHPRIKAAQKQLVELFTTPVLKYFDPDRQAIVETDASDFALGGILSQRHDGSLHPVAFHSREFTAAEINYDTTDKELTAIVDCSKR